MNRLYLFKGSSTVYGFLTRSLDPLASQFETLFVAYIQASRLSHDLLASSITHKQTIRSHVVCDRYTYRSLTTFTTDPVPEQKHIPCDHNLHQLSYPPERSSMCSLPNRFKAPAFFRYAIAFVSCSLSLVLAGSIKGYTSSSIS